MKLVFREMVENDLDYALECHCRVCHASNNFRGDRPAYDAFRDRFVERGVWDESRAHILESMKDERTLATIAESEHGDRVGYCWVVFSDWFEEHKADISGIFVEEPFRRRGVAMGILSYIEKQVRERGANLLVSDTGVDNVVSQAMHEKYGFEPRWYHYHKWL
mgnify:FL=1